MAEYKGVWNTWVPNQCKLCKSQTMHTQAEHFFLGGKLANPDPVKRKGRKGG